MPLIKQTLTIMNRRGLHARAAAKFVQTASNFTSSIEVERGGSTVSATSIMGLMTLAASIGTDVEIRAYGDDANEAVEALARLITDRFEEDE